MDSSVRPRGEDLRCQGVRDQARRHDHHVAEDVTVLHQDRARVQADPDLRLIPVHRRPYRDIALHLDRSQSRVARILERRHDFVTDELDDFSVVGGGGCAQPFHQRGNEQPSPDIPESLVEPAAVVHVRE
jgi:hypothetical protein